MRIGLKIKIKSEQEIRDTLCEGSLNGPADIYWNKTMKQFCGKVGIISHIEYDPYTGKESYCLVNGWGEWSFDPAWVEPQYELPEELFIL